MGMTPASVEELEKARPKLRIDKLLRECAVPITDNHSASTNVARPEVDSSAGKKKSILISNINTFVIPSFFHLI
jgi:hypothetical protein